MDVRERLARLVGGGTAGSATEQSAPARDPSHVCESCGEEYYTDPGMEIQTCRNCGGVKVRRFESQPA